MKMLNLFLLIVIKSIHSFNIYKNLTIPLDFSQQVDINTGCIGLTIPNNYKRLALNFNTTNIDKLLITDVSLEKCDESTNIEKCCSANSTFCINNSNPTNYNFKLNYCIDNTFVYACKFANPNNTETDSNNNSSSIIVTTSIDSVNGCSTNEFIPETECSSLGIDTCKNPHLCVKKCSYVECRRDILRKETKVFDMCLPADTPMSETITRCANHIQFEGRTPEVYILPCTNEVYVDDIRKEPSHKFFKLLLIVFGAIVLITFISSIYYRFKINLDGTPPFDAPIFCPQFIFPRN
jgi:hypothetical protein